MILKKIVLFVCMVSMTTTANNQQPKSLKSATSELAKLARVTNGFTVQSELTKDPKLFSAITSELLGIGSTTLLDTLLAFNASTVSNDLNTLFDGIQNAKISKVDTVQVGNKINAIKLMTDKVDDLTKGITVNVDDLKTKMAAANQNVQFSKMPTSAVKEYAESLKVVLNSPITLTPEMYDHEKKLQHLKTSVIDFIQDFNTVIKKQTLGYDKLLALKGAVEVLKPLQAVSKIVRSYSTDVQKPETLASDLNKMKTDITNLVPILAASQKKLDTSSITSVLKALEDNSKATLSRSRTLGFMNGVSDIQQLFKDLKGAWLKKNIGNGQSIAKLVPKLEKLKTFADKVVPLESSWSKLSNHTNAQTDVDTVIKLLELMQGSGKNVKDTTALGASIGSMEGFFKPLKAIAKLPDLDTFEKLVPDFEALEKNIIGMENILDDAAANEYFPKIQLLHDIKNHVGDETNDLGIIGDEMKKVRDMAGMKELSNFLSDVVSKLEATDKTSMATLINGNVDWNVVQEVQTSLTNTGLLPALTSIKTLKYDAQATDSFVKFADSVRTIQAKSAEVTGTKAFLTELSAVVTTGNTAKSSMQTTKQGKRPKRQPPVRLDSHVAHQLGTAVQVLQNMAVVSEKKTKVIGLADAKASVTAEVVAVAQDVWTDGNRAAMKSTVVEVEKLEKFVQGLANDDWDTLVKVFDEAAKVKGAPIDTKKFADPIGQALEKSTDPDVKAAAVEFRDLSTLELDFASKEKDLKTASLTLNPIRAFFDQVLGISRIQQGSQTLVTQEPGSDLWTYLTPTLASLFTLILALVLSFVFWKRREARLKKEYKAELAKQHKLLVEDMENMMATAKKNQQTRDMYDMNFLRDRLLATEDQLHVARRECFDAQGKLVDAEGKILAANDQARFNQIDRNEEAARADDAVAANARLVAAILERNRGYAKVYANRGVLFANHANELRGVVADKTNCVFKAVEAADHDSLTELIARGDPLDVFMLHKGLLVTPLILACKLKDLNSMTLLLMAGANPMLLGSNGKSAERVLKFDLAIVQKDMIRDEKERFIMVRWRKKKRGRDLRYDRMLDSLQLSEKLIHCFEQYQTNDQVQKNMPDLLPIGKYNFAVDRTEATSTFRNKFQKKINRDYPVTHRISPTDVYQLEPTVESLTHVFEPQPLLKPSYMTACVADPKAIGDDYLHRVTELKWKDKVYDIVETLKFYALGHWIPPMFGVNVTYHGDGDMNQLARYLGFTLKSAEKSTMSQYNEGKVNWIVYGPEGKERAQQEYDKIGDKKAEYGFYSIEEMVDKLLESYKKMDIPTAQKGTEAEIAEFIQLEKVKREADWELKMEEKREADEKQEKKEKAYHKQMDTIHNRMD